MLFSIWMKNGLVIFLENVRAKVYVLKINFTGLPKSSAILEFSTYNDVDFVTNLVFQRAL